VAATDATYKSAVDAHALEDALKLVDTESAFKGTVAKVYEPRGLAIVEFDADYKTALTAIVRFSNFDKFPALTNLIGKNVLVTGKFTKYRENAQVVMEKPEQIKIVEEAKEAK
jgi:DNA/RNA endonuclease YhcR with UshA esterase domain